LIADCLEEALIDAGFRVCGIARTVADAVELATCHDPGLGVIDVNLGGGRTGTEIAAALRRRGPFGVLYVTGNPEHPALAAAEGEGCLIKPYSLRSVVAALGIVDTLVAGRPVSCPLPRGFRRMGAGYMQPGSAPG
jgi:DNA-binding response OmpR family regulator